MYELQRMPTNNFKIAQDIVTSYEARVKVVAQIAEDTNKLLDAFRQKRETMSQELKGALAQHESLRKKDFDKMMGEILVAQSEREENVKQMLSNFQSQEMSIVENLRAMLKKGEKLRLKDFKKTLVKIKIDQEMHQKETVGHIGTELTRMQVEVKDMLENFKTERQKVASEWSTMVAQMGQIKNVNPA